MENDKKAPDVDWLMEKLYAHMRKHYRPTTSPNGNSQYYTTIELYQKLGDIYPEMPIAPNELAHWLQQEGYQFTETNDKIYWIMDIV